MVAAMVRVLLIFLEASTFLTAFGFSAAGLAAFLVASDLFLVAAALDFLAFPPLTDLMSFLPSLTVSIMVLVLLTGDFLVAEAGALAGAVVVVSGAGAVVVVSGAGSLEALVLSNDQMKSKRFLPFVGDFFFEALLSLGAFLIFLLAATLVPLAISFSLNL